MNANLTAVAAKDGHWLTMAMYLTKNNLDEARELVQETYLKIHNRLTNSKLPPLKEITEGYMWRAIKGQFFTKKTGNKEILTNDFEQFDRIDDLEILELRHMVADSLDELPYLEREILLQHQEKSQRQLQKDTGVCRDRLRTHKNRGLAKLEKSVKKKYKPE